MSNQSPTPKALPASAMKEVAAPRRRREEEMREAVGRSLALVEERRAEMREGDKELARLGRETRRIIKKMQTMFQ